MSMAVAILVVGGWWLVAGEGFVCLFSGEAGMTTSGVVGGGGTDALSLSPEEAACCTCGSKRLFDCSLWLGVIPA